jgi:pyruvate kinase
MPLVQPFSECSRTKIIATVGPACRSVEQLSELVKAGVDLFRINMAHSSEEGAQRQVDDIRAVGNQLGQPIGILADLAGPKIRLGELPDGSVNCDFGAIFDLVRGAVAQQPNALTSTYGPLVDELSPGDMVLLADGTVSMEVVEKLSDRARCRVVQPGVLRSRQGINLPGVKLSAPALGEEDIRNARWAARAGVDYLGLSFVRSADDIRQLQALLAAENSEADVVAKIEKPQALDLLEEIVAAADAVMVARGDLGVEIDVARVPMEQKRIIRTCRRMHKPVIIATQMLDSMQHASRPTRAEASDVANAILDGADACMLSGETAIGEFPRQSVEMMNRIALTTEAQMAGDSISQDIDAVVAGLHETTHAVVIGAGMVARRLHAKLVVVASHSGATAQALSGLRGGIFTVGVSDSEKTLRRMNLLWGVAPLKGVPARDVNSIIQHIENWGRKAGALAAGDRIVVVCGSPLAQGVHDMLMVHEVGKAR